MTMHTNGGCTMVNKNCQGEGGCGTETGGSASFSDGFNNAQGGVYAMEWTSSAINIWFFPRSSIPNGATGSNPDPSSWGNPTASFQGGPGCTIDDHFKNNNIVFDTTFCGDWAGSIWAQDTTCSAKAATCQDYVQNHPEAFESAYWSINSLKVYSDNGNAAPAQAAPVPSPSPKAAEPVAQPTATSTKPVVPATTPTATANEGNVGRGSSTPGGTVTENPTTGGPGKRELDGSPFSSVVEQPAVTRREGTEEVVVKRGGVGRHLRRHAKAGHAHHRHS